MNANGLNNAVKRKKILLQMERDKEDVISLQETHLRRQEHEKLKEEFNSQVYYSTYSSASRGVATIIKSKIGFKKESCIKDKEERFVLAVGKIDSMEISSLNVYYPPDIGPDFMLELIELMTTKCKGTVIRGGGFNPVLNPKSILRKTCTEIGLVDVWRTLHLYRKEFTFYSGRHLVYNRLLFYV